MTIKDSEDIHRFAEHFCQTLKESREKLDKELRRRAATPSKGMMDEEKIGILLPRIFRFCAYEHLLLVDEPKNPVNLICAELVSLNSSDLIARAETALKIGMVDKTILREFEEYQLTPPSSNPPNLSLTPL